MLSIHQCRLPIRLTMRCVSGRNRACTSSLCLREGEATDCRRMSGPRRQSENLCGKAFPVSAAGPSFRLPCPSGGRGSWGSAATHQHVHARSMQWRAFHSSGGKMSLKISGNFKDLPLFTRLGITGGAVLVGTAVVFLGVGFLGVGLGVGVLGYLGFRIKRSLDARSPVVTALGDATREALLMSDAAQQRYGKSVTTGAPVFIQLEEKAGAPSHSGIANAFVIFSLEGSKIANAVVHARGEKTADSAGVQKLLSLTAIDMQFPLNPIVLPLPVIGDSREEQFAQSQYRSRSRRNQKRPPGRVQEAEFTEKNKG